MSNRKTSPRTRTKPALVAKGRAPALAPASAQAIASASQAAGFDGPVRLSKGHSADRPPSPPPAPDIPTTQSSAAAGGVAKKEG